MSSIRSIISHPVSRSENAITFAVVVTARQLGGVRFGYGRASYPRHLVRRHRDAEARTADDDPALGLAGGDGFADGVAILRVIDRRLVVRSEIERLVTSIAKQLRDKVLVLKTGVICAEGDFHELVTSYG